MHGDAHQRSNGKSQPRLRKSYAYLREKRLLTPEYVDEETGWHHYSIDQSTKLDLILELQQVGFSLDEIAAITHKGDVDHLRRLLSAKKDELTKQIENLTIARDVVESYVSGCDQYLYQTVMDQIMLEMLPERRILMFELPANLKEAHAAVKTSTSFETILRFTRQSIVDRGYPLVLFRDVCSVLNIDHLHDGQDPFITHTFVFAENAALEGCATLPAGPHLTLYNDQAYAPDGTSLSSQRAQRMVAYAEKKGLVIEGTVFGETICRWPRLFGEGTKVLHRLCLPVHY